MGNKKVLLTKLWSIITAEDGVKTMRWFFRGFEINIDEKYYTRITELKDSMVKTINIDPSTIPPQIVKDEKTGEEKSVPFNNEGETFSTDTATCISNSNVFVFLYIVADIEETFKKYGVDNPFMSMAAAKKILRIYRAKIKLDLQEKFDKTFLEIEKTIGNLEAAANGHPEGLYSSNEEVMDLFSRNVTIKPEKKDGEEKSEETEDSENGDITFEEYFKHLDENLKKAEKVVESDETESEQIKNNDNLESISEKIDDTLVEENSELSEQFEEETEEEVVEETTNEEVITDETENNCPLCQVYTKPKIDPNGIKLGDYLIAKRKEYDALFDGIDTDDLDAFENVLKQFDTYEENARKIDSAIEHLRSIGSDEIPNARTRLAFIETEILIHEKEKWRKEADELFDTKDSEEESEQLTLNHAEPIQPMCDGEDTLQK